MTDRDDSPVDALVALFGPGQLNRVQVALVLGISKSRVQQIERVALAKLRRHPAMRELARTYGLQAEDE